MDKKCVLLVHSNNSLRDALCDFLILNGGYEVIALSNHHAAYKWLAKHQWPDMVLTEFHPQLCRGDFLAKAAQEKSVPAAIITAHIQECIESISQLHVKSPVIPSKASFSKILEYVNKPLKA